MSLALTGTVLWWALAGLVWHLVSGRTWGDTMTVMASAGGGVTIGQWAAPVIRRKWGDLRDS
ncbi:hypothetical protein ACWEIK_14135 [Streptomyces sp. NPDC004673]